MTQLIALDTLPDRPIEVGGIVSVVVVSAANVVKDVRENIRPWIQRCSNWRRVRRRRVMTAWWASS